MNHFILLTIALLATFFGVTLADPKYEDFCGGKDPQPKPFLTVCLHSNDGDLSWKYKTSDDMGLYKSSKDPTIRIPFWRTANINQNSRSHSPSLESPSS
ncbi:uncharacterized protein SPSC_04673 [Sporisorium scitamineum]|uniref:Mig1 protein n=1 Tax=Sporisorium scitamineum TaxID=49012 RepID=A0A127ZFE8_9BASI|nr:uncharacterized protein SPSC_04673 [Sporisorium scitamineum]